MSLRFFIDGYNVIRSSEWLSQGSLGQQRERLIRFIEQKSPCGSSRNHATVVFDGRPGRDGRIASASVTIVFSDEVDADTVIKDQVDALVHPADAVVVTNDKAIQRWVRGAKARVISCEEFLAKGRAAQPKIASSEGPDPDSTRRINEEFKRIWKMK